MIDRKKLDEIIAKNKVTDQEYIRMCDDNIDMLTVEVWQLKEKLNIAVKAMEWAKNTYPMCNLRIIDEALNQIRGKGK